jgi:hypothetical protein
VKITLLVRRGSAVLATGRWPCPWACGAGDPAVQTETPGGKKPVKIGVSVYNMMSFITRMQPQMPSPPSLRCSGSGVEHSMLTAAWHMLTTGELYKDPGADYFTRQAPAKTKPRAIGQLESLG